ncbi:MULTISPECIES: HIT domain-containing protein [unclassified Legionella]|uniref:HIT domain-containing protein n=1 Tax=unclassified Legionella TaxID=2622702 RepID=UPI0010543DEE|nr:MULTISPECIES: HIT domain-containing protein [unclassified Legionella]MDI9818108.1 HIT domain-containing protein [Legionella sp. PL877]
MSFKVDERIQSTSFELVDWPLSRVFLKDESRFPWFILIPRVENIDEIHQLGENSSHQLIQEISRISEYIKASFNPFKINVAALGNIVQQLHIHVVGRYKSDPFWPHSIWQPSYEAKPYDKIELAEVKVLLKALF